MSPKVLIIDDEADVIKYLSVILQANGFEPYTASNVKDALVQVEQVSPDLICLDIMMPQETGLSFYSKMKSDKKYKDIPVIIISGVVQPGGMDIDSYLDDKSVVPPEFFMEKPINVTEFIKTVKKLVGKGGLSKKGQVT